MVRQANKADLDQLSNIFNLYRIYYDQKSDLVLAHEFLSDRIQLKESVIYVYESEGKILGFTQIYFTFSSVSAKKS